MTIPDLGPASGRHVVVRLAHVDDADEASLVLRRSITELCKPDYSDAPGRLENWLANKTPDTFRKWLAQSDLTMLLAIDDGQVAGVGATHKDGVVVLNYVDPSRRFMGISSALLTAMEEQAHAAGVTQLRLESTKTAERFYRARGYQTWKKAGKAGLWLSKDISANGG